MGQIKNIKLHIVTDIKFSSLSTTISNGKNKANWKKAEK